MRALSGCTIKSCPGVGSATGVACPTESASARRYADDSIRRSHIFKFKMAMKEQLVIGKEWYPVEKKDKPSSGPQIDSYLMFVTEEQKQVGVPVNNGYPRWPSCGTFGLVRTGPARWPSNLSYWDIV